jgi:omega-hydroxy-beta-dihydromenaquinone-9 sulfotransferase
MKTLIARAALPDSRFHQLTYEELIREPVPTLERCYAALSLGDFAMVKHRAMDYLSTVRDSRVNEFEVSSPGRDAVRQAWGPIFRKWGYDI